MIRRLVLVFVIAIFVGFGAWYTAHSVLLPVETAADKSGHGPDPGSEEWNSTIERLTQKYRKNAIIVGVSSFCLALSLGGLLTLTFAMAKSAGNSQKERIKELVQN